MNGSTETSTQGTPTPSLRRTELGLPDMSGSFATSLVSLQFQMRVRVDAMRQRKRYPEDHGIYDCMALYGKQLQHWQFFNGSLLRATFRGEARTGPTPHHQTTDRSTRTVRTDYGLQPWQMLCDVAILGWLLRHM